MFQDQHGGNETEHGDEIEVEQEVGQGQQQPGGNRARGTDGERQADHHRNAESENHGEQHQLDNGDAKESPDARLGTLPGFLDGGALTEDGSADGDGQHSAQDDGDQGGDHGTDQLAPDVAEAERCAERVFGVLVEGRRTRQDCRRRCRLDSEDQELTDDDDDGGKAECGLGVGSDGRDGAVVERG
ncbi:Uncharacterised protein [Mycobacteroides abscessus subsp. abscessus]|nr:Uncharacterised protein [Mycobacteroides abscessus subsp. abscessus]